MDEPRWLLREEVRVDLPGLAAAYGYGLAKNHGYVDGNKRVAFFSLVLFLRRNGFLLRAPQDEVVRIMEDLAAGTCDEVDLARWVRQHVQKRGNPGGGDRTP